MKFVDEYRDATAAQTYAAAIVQSTAQPWTIMEICGGTDSRDRQIWH
jgi:hydrogenase expression/formation protein HypD